MHYQTTTKAGGLRLEYDPKVLTRWPATDTTFVSKRGDYQVRIWLGASRVAYPLHQEANRILASNRLPILVSLGPRFGLVWSAQNRAGGKVVHHFAEEDNLHLRCESTYTLHTNLQDVERGCEEVNTLLSTATFWAA